MKDPTALPMALAQVNQELQARIADLVQSGGQHWYDFVQRLVNDVNDGIVEGSAELQEVLDAQDWQQLLSMPVEGYWQQLQQRFGEQQAAAQVAVAAQASFARGIQDALAAWQHDTISALDQAGLATPALDPDWVGLFVGWETVLPDTATATPPARKKAATRKAATGKPPVRKAAKKKPAANKASAKKTTAKKKPGQAKAKAAPAKAARKATAARKPATKSTRKARGRG